MTSIAPGNQTVDPPRRSRALGFPRWLPRPTLIILRLLPLIPVLLVTVLPAAALTGDDGAVATLKQNAAGVLGNAALLSLAVTFAITSVALPNRRIDHRLEVIARGTSSRVAKTGLSEEQWSLVEYGLRAALPAAEQRPCSVGARG